MKTEQAKLPFLYTLMVFFSMTPFLLPIPGLNTDLQPYAILLSLFVLLCYNPDIGKALSSNYPLLLLLLPFAISFAFLAADLFSVKALRGAYNHFSLFLVFLALYILLNRFGFQEKHIKAVLWIWFAVATIQFFFDKTFLAALISGTRENAYGRGVVGLCSEASFFGISCFYFLHLANRFTKRRVLYLLLITFMAVIYAQSMQGVLFVAIFFVGFLLDNVREKKGVIAVILVACGCVLTFLLLRRVAPTSRLMNLLNSFLNDGVMATIQGDASASTRLGSITGALSEAFDSWLIPQGFDRRLGSGFGGLLVELGLFGLIETLVIAYCFSIHFQSRHTRIVYFVLIYFILFSNTQMGNSQMLFVLASNMYFNKQEKLNESK